MKEQFVSYKIALKLKQLGFDEECLMWYCHEHNLTDDSIFRQYEKEDYFCEAPLWQQVIDWFREKHLIEVDATSYYYPKYYAIVSKIGFSHERNNFPDEEWCEKRKDGRGKQKYEKVIVYSERKFNSYYEARETAILKAIEIYERTIN